MNKRIRVEVRPDKAAGCWKVFAGAELLSEHPTQRKAVAAAAKWCRAEALAGKLLTLKIKGRNGQIRDDRTYPRASDPKRSRG